MFLIQLYENAINVSYEYQYYSHDWNKTALKILPVVNLVENINIKVICFTLDDFFEITMSKIIKLLIKEREGHNKYYNTL